MGEIWEMAKNPLWLWAVGICLAYFATAELADDIDDLLRGYHPGDQLLEVAEGSATFARLLKAVTSKAVSNAEQKEVEVKAQHTKTTGDLSALAKNAPDIKKLDPEVVAASGKEDGVKKELDEKAREEKAAKKKEQERIQRLKEEAEKVAQQ